ncbi:iron complex transport system substrate-binding protein [Nocardioides albertanoniae]|uniref:Iron complex transport system substrate-binding protein n=1 Tax=Nocardioides albertanoniae TaxID=1175486 RepID=A0A543A647_9ACTN|nr:iron-siderophore ABC transporter substrate-binding protein [Nocardioides albertanoniae]TQL67966.1 iron complex transport system substrate-binding protein [Nocardioides albertanoniae]
MRKHLTGVIATATAAIVLAACGGTSTGEDSDVETREVKHAKGVAEVPVDPKRVVVLDTGELDDALALGVKPVGAVRVDVATDFLSYLGDQTEGIKEVGTISEPNLEKIAALDPDLILSSTVRHEAIYDQLSEIAPTVLAPDVGDTWKDNFLLYADALNKTDEAKKMLSEFEGDAAEVGKSVGEGKTLSIVRFLPGQIRLYSDKSFTGVILDDMGMTVPEKAVGEDTFLELSPEQVTTAQADHLYVSTYGPENDTDKAKVLGGPLWKRIPAVEAGQVDEINDDLLTGIGIQAAQQILAQFEKELG